MPWSWKAPNGQTYLVTDRWSLLNHIDRVNMESEVRALDGRNPKEVFGEDVPLGEISFTDWSPDTCGCVHRHLANLTAAVPEPMPHRGLKHCAAHAHHKDDHGAHYGAILRENQHKNATVHVLATEHSIEDVKEISFAYDNRRVLSVSHPAFGKKVVPQPKAN